jgi:ABC-type amino acid transport substrate-binding protein
LANDDIQIALLDSYPWSFQGDDGRIIGIYPDLLQEVESNIRSNINFDGKIELRLNLHPMARIKHDMKASKYVDLTIMSFPPGRDQLMTPLLKIYSTPFIVLSRENQPIRTMKGLESKRLAVLQGGSGCPCLGDAIPQQKIYVNDHLQSLKMLKGGRVDAAAGPAIRILGNVSMLKFENDIAPPLIYEWRDIWLWAKKSYSNANAGEDENNQRIDKFKFEFKKLIDSGGLKKYAKKYLSKEQLVYVYENNKKNQ